MATIVAKRAVKGLIRLTKSVGTEGGSTLPQLSYFYNSIFLEVACWKTSFVKLVDSVVEVRCRFESCPQDQGSRKIRSIRVGEGPGFSPRNAEVETFDSFSVRGSTLTGSFLIS